MTRRDISFCNSDAIIEMNKEEAKDAILKIEQLN